MIEVLGWVGNINFIVGMLLIANKDRMGFLFNTVGNACYVGQGYLNGTLSLVAISIFLIAVNVYGITRWRNDG